MNTLVLNTIESNNVVIATETKKVRKQSLKCLANKAIKDNEYSISGAIKRVISQLDDKSVLDYIESLGFTKETYITALKPINVLRCFPFKIDDNDNIICLKKYKGNYVIKDKFSVWDILTVSKILAKNLL
jgi:hypothetical protein